MPVYTEPGGVGVIALDGMSGDEFLAVSCHFENNEFFLGGISGMLEPDGVLARLMEGGSIAVGDDVLLLGRGRDSAGGFVGGGEDFGDDAASLSCFSIALSSVESEESSGAS